MSIGTSGRIVIEVDPALKRHLYSALAREGLTLKDWFLREARIFVVEAQQMRLALSPSDEGAGSDSSLRSGEGRDRANVERKTSAISTAASEKVKAHEE
jgi:hypothetical protein